MTTASTSSATAAPAGGAGAATAHRPTDRAARLVREHPLLMAVLLGQAVASIRLRNTAFQDEALYLVTGRWFIDSWTHGGAVTSDPSAWFTGAPQLYPVLAAALDGLGGLELARLLSTACMLTATAAVYSTTERLFASPGHRAGALAALAFALTGAVMVMGHFATFDAPSVAAVAAATAVGVRAARCETTGRHRWSVLSGVLLAVAVLLKYASAIDVPFALLVVAASTLRLRGARWRGAVAGAVAGGVALVLLAASAATWARPLLGGALSSTLHRQSLAPEPTSQLLGRVADIAGPALALALVGGLVLLRRRPALAAALLAGTLAAPVAQISTGESVSIWKTGALGMVFGAVLVGHLCSVLARRWWGGWVVAAALFSAALLGLSSSAQWFRSWPDTAPLTAALQPVVAAAAPGALFAGEDPEPLEYALHSRPDRWAATYDGAFTYRGAADLPAFQQALRDRRFAVVVLDGTTTIGGRLQPQMPGLAYQRAAQVRSPSGDHQWTVWRPAGS